MKILGSGHCRHRCCQCIIIAVCFSGVLAWTGPQLRLHVRGGAASPSIWNPQSRHQQQQEPEDGMMELDRAAFRLDGLEVYAVVSALALSTSIQFFELLSEHWHFGMALAATTPQWEVVLGWITDLICLVASSLGMITSLHATLIFSLVTVYGRTAVGMKWDGPCHRFFQCTDAVRHRGFRSFRISLYTFLVQILFIIVTRMPPSKWLRRGGCLVLSLAMWSVYRDTQFIIDTAGTMLFPKPPAATEAGQKK